MAGSGQAVRADLGGSLEPATWAISSTKLKKTVDVSNVNHLWHNQEEEHSQYRYVTFGLLHNFVRFCTEIQTIPSIALGYEDKKHHHKYSCLIVLTITFWDYDCTL